jgi:hypothetical protein
MFMDGWFFFVFGALPVGGAPTIHHSYFNDLLDVSVACIQDMISSDGRKISELLEDPVQSVLCREIEVPEQTEIIASSLA